MSRRAPRGPRRPPSRRIRNRRRGNHRPRTSRPRCCSPRCRAADRRRTRRSGEDPPYRYGPSGPPAQRKESAAGEARRIYCGVHVSYSGAKIAKNRLCRNPQIGYFDRAPSGRDGGEAPEQGAGTPEGTVPACTDRSGDAPRALRSLRADGPQTERKGHRRNEARAGGTDEAQTESARRRKTQGATEEWSARRRKGRSTGGTGRAGRTAA